MDLYSPTGSMLLFETVWGKGKAGKRGDGGQVPAGGSVALDGPVCWWGDAPALTVVPNGPAGEEPV
jgi:hypothetical protein